MHNTMTFTILFFKGAKVYFFRKERGVPFFKKRPILRKSTKMGIFGRYKFPPSNRNKYLCPSIQFKQYQFKYDTLLKEYGKRNYHQQST